MRLTHLCDMELATVERPILVRPYGGEEGHVFFGVEGTLVGERLHGKLRLVNLARRRSDGIMLPDLHGALTTGDGAAILLTMQGLAVPVPGTTDPLLNQMLHVSFATDDTRYRWLNDLLCVVEGTVSMHGGTPRQVAPARMYQCVNELLS